MSRLRVTDTLSLASYIVNQNPALKAEIGLPTQGMEPKDYGKLISKNDRYKNMFINTVNLIGLTLIKKNNWDNPWEIFANRGTLNRGQQIRELIQDLAKVYDYNDNYDNKTKFLSTEVPDVYNYIHNLNFQKFYATTVNESELQMAFEDDSSLLEFIEDTIGNLYESFKYDKYLADKYQLCRRILDGTVPTKQIENFANKDAREILAEMKAVSNLMSFKSPNYNPAGVRRATRFDDQFLMIDATREAINSTNVFATSYFLDEAKTKTNMALIDTFSETDEARLTELLGSDFTPFTDAEKTQLGQVVGMIFSRDWFMDYFYAIDNNENPEGKRQTEFMNPTTLDRNVFLHTWLVLSTSPFANCCVFTTGTPAVSSISVSPQLSTVTPGQSIQLSATVATTGFANKSVFWEIPDQFEDTGVTVDQTGKVQIPADIEIAPGAPGVYTVTVATAVTEGGRVVLLSGDPQISVTVNVTSELNTAIKQATAIQEAIENDTDFSMLYDVTRNGAVLTLTEKPIGVGAPEVDSEHSTLGSGVINIATTTAPIIPTDMVAVNCYSIFDNTKSASAMIRIVPMM